MGFFCKIAHFNIIHLLNLSGNLSATQIRYAAHFIFIASTVNLTFPIQNPIFKW